MVRKIVPARVERCRSMLALHSSRPGTAIRNVSPVRKKDILFVVYSLVGQDTT